MVALALLATAAAVAVKVAELVAAAILTEAGTVSRELVFDSVMTAPPTGAFWDRVTVQLVEELAARVVAAQDTEDTEIGATKGMLKLAALPA